MEAQLRRAARFSDDLNIAPEYALGVAGTQGFHGGFLRGEPSRKVGRGVPAPGRIGNFAFGKDPPQESIAVLCDRRFDAIDFSGIYSKPDNIRRHVPSTA